MYTLKNLPSYQLQHLRVIFYETGAEVSAQSLTKQEFSYAATTFRMVYFWSSDITLTHGHGHKAKYPKIYYNYESVDVPDMFFVGTVTHSLDLRKSAGGFVHGFRYSCEYW